MKSFSTVWGCYGAGRRCSLAGRGKCITSGSPQCQQMAMGTRSAVCRGRGSETRAPILPNLEAAGSQSHPCISQQRLRWLERLKELYMLVLQELLDHLEGMLSNEAVEVSGGQSIVEVKPQVGAKLGPRCLYRDLAVPAGGFAGWYASLKLPKGPCTCNMHLQTTGSRRLARFPHLLCVTQSLRTPCPGCPWTAAPY